MLAIEECDGGSWNMLCLVHNYGCEYGLALNFGEYTWLLKNIEFDTWHTCTGNPVQPKQGLRTIIGTEPLLEPRVIEEPTAGIFAH